MQNAQSEHSAIPSTFMKLPFVIKIFVLSIFEWPLKTGFSILNVILQYVDTRNVNQSMLDLVKEDSVYTVAVYLFSLETLPANVLHHNYDLSRCTSNVTVAHISALNFLWPGDEDPIQEKHDIDLGCLKT